MRARMKSKKCKRPQFFFCRRPGRSSGRAWQGRARADHRADGRAKCNRSNLLQCRNLLQCSNASAAMQVQQFSAMQQCRCSNAGAAMQAQQCRCSNFCNAAMKVQQCRRRKKCRTAATSAGGHRWKRSPHRWKRSPHRWKRSDPTDGKVHRKVINPKS
jgi:hypothetical protein